MFADKIRLTALCPHDAYLPLREGRDPLRWSRATQPSGAGSPYAFHVDFESHLSKAVSGSDHGGCTPYTPPAHGVSGGQGPRAAFRLFHGAPAAQDPLKTTQRRWTKCCFSVLFCFGSSVVAATKQTGSAHNVARLLETPTELLPRKNLFF